MHKTFNPQETEAKIYEWWESKSYNKTPDVDGVQFKEPYTILMPPPNANASLHAGHAMYATDDVLVRWKRLQGIASTWIPGMDHAGFETQFVFEKHLRKEKKSRFDFDRKTLYDKIFDFVKDNSGLIYDQFKALGFLADWDKSVFTLDEDVVSYVYETFQLMIKDGLVYRDEYIVNYCTFDGTSLAELEVNYVERTDSLYYIRYKFVNEDDHFNDKPYITVATVRPEPIFADTHLAVHPDNPTTKELIGKKVRNPLTDEDMEIIADEFVDPDFGTGIVKLTPAHDPHDFEVAKKHGLPIRKAVDIMGKIVPEGGKYAGMKVQAARAAVVDDLREKGLIDTIDDEYDHSVITCYKCGRDLEPMTIPNWFVKVDSLKKRVKEVVQNDDIEFHPHKYKQQMLDWLDVMHDWPISRQIVWGIRIPVWYKYVKNAGNIYVSWIDNKGKNHHMSVDDAITAGFSLSDIREGLQSLTAATGKKAPEYVVSEKSPGDDYLPETDTFDTWFSSGQWPLVTVKGDDLATRFPTDFMATMKDILRFWISRMIMFSLYRRDQIPFKHAYLWSMVADKEGKKMSKSKGNTINPLDLIQAYGADALRGSLFFGAAQGGKVNLSDDKVRSMRNYANKMWNIGRFIWMNQNPDDQTLDYRKNMTSHLELDDKGKTILESLQKEWEETKKKSIKNMNSFHFGRVFDAQYEFLWHRFADYYLEELKDYIRSGNIDVLEALEKIYTQNLQIIHPFMPFVTEAVWKEFFGEDASILDSRI